MTRPPCTCADPRVGAEVHCALLRDFPGGFYGDLENAEYMGEPSLWCDCECHGDDLDDPDVHGEVPGA